MKVGKKTIGTVVGLLFIGIGAVVEHQRERQRDAEKLQAIIRDMGARMKKADKDYAQNLKSAGLENALAVLGSDRIADPDSRRSALETFASAVRLIDEALATRARIPEDALKQLQAAEVDGKLKETAVAGFRTAMASAQPKAVEMMKATRAFVVKAEETVAHVDRYAAGLAVRNGELEFADPLGTQIYGALQSELGAIQQQLRGMKP